MHQNRIGRRAVIAGLVCAAGLTLSVMSPAMAWSEKAPAVSQAAAEAGMQGAYPGVAFHRTGTAITTVYGNSFSFGDSAESSAAAFLNTSMPLFGVNLADLVAGSLAGDGAHSRQVMPMDGINGAPAGFKFTLLSYLQTKDGIPVYRADLRLLMRNEPGSPLVLARSGLRNLGDFVVDQALAAKPNMDGAFADAGLRFPGINNFTAPEVVIYAGDSDHPAAPTLALVFEGTVGHTGDANYAKWRIIADARTGQAITVENLVHNVDVSGNISAQITTGFKSAECNPEALTALPFARASIGATNVFADASGNFTIPNAGSAAVTVVGSLQGKFFEVFNPTALAPTVSGSFTPPGPANLVLNSANTVEQRRAEANAYFFANTARNFVLTAAPSYPTISTQTAFRVNTAVSGTCNAFYDGASINFYNSGGGCANTAYSDVVEHEYGHHVVDRAGSGQGQYGEGTGDCMGVVINDQPILGFGFQNNCAAGIRTADNTYQYPQSGEIHDAGQLISGCVWSLRNQLIVTEPSNYKAILGRLMVNAVLLHTGSTIEPQIYTDYLTLDDNDGNLGNGTPHFCEINAAFAAHNMASAASSLATFTFPSGQPTLISPAGAPGQVKIVSGLCATIIPSSAKVFIDKENDGTYVQSSLTDVGGSIYTFNFPATACGSTLRYYFSVQTTTGTTLFNPTGVPTSYYSVSSAYGNTVAFNDNFQTNQGWVATASGATTGQWQRGVPVTATRGEPSADYDGSGQCFLTQNQVGDFDVDGGSVTLTSPAMNGVGSEAFLSYARWYDNTGAGSGSNPGTHTFVVEVSNNNGASWVNLETVGPVTQSSGGWFAKTFSLSTKFALTNQIRVRFTASDSAASPSVVEAAVDAVKLQVIDCTPPSCPADFNHDGFLNGDDFDAFVAAFEAGNISADFNSDGFVNGDDFDAYVAAFELGC